MEGASARPLEAAVARQEATAELLAMGLYLPGARHPVVVVPAVVVRSSVEPVQLVPHLEVVVEERRSGFYPAPLQVVMGGQVASWFPITRQRHA